jgi:hypothetical protein
MSEPANANGKSIATNAYSLVAVPFRSCFFDANEKVKNIYPVPANMDKLITLAELKEKLSNFPLVDCFDVEEAECGACYGDGEVTFEFDYKRESYELEGECPVCDGHGIILKKSETPNGKKELDSSKFFKIGRCIFHVDRINEILFVAEKLQSDIRLVHQTEENHNCVFAVGDVEIMAMPTVGDMAELNVCQTIEI